MAGINETVDLSVIKAVHEVYPCPKKYFWKKKFPLPTDPILYKPVTGCIGIFLPNVDIAYNYIDY